MKRLAVLCLGLLLAVPSLVHLSAARKSAPLPEHLGYKPRFDVAYFTCLDYRLLLSELFFYDAIFYYGSLIMKPEQQPDYRMIVQYVDTATRLNPYNIDAYYFGQAVLTWDAGLVKEMNQILKRGVKKRDWDYYLPFFLGFNYSYFLNDFAAAGEYTMMAARLNPDAGLLPTLASRYLYMGHKTEQAISYLKVVYAGTRNEGVRTSILTRLMALEAISMLEKACKSYEEQVGRPPAALADLVTSGILKGLPPDPYGGRFYIDHSDGRIKTTSKMADPGSRQ